MIAIRKRLAAAGAAGILGGVRARMTIALLAAAAVPLLVMYVLTTTLAARRIFDSEVEKMTRLSAELGRNVTMMLDRTSSDLAGFTRSSLLTDERIPWSRRRRAIHEFGDLHPEFSQLVLYDADGYVIEATQGAAYQRDITEWQQRASAGEIAISPPRFSDGTDALTISAYLPVYGPPQGSGGQGTMVLRADLSLQGIGELIAGFETGAGGEIVLLDSSGTVLAHRDRGRVLGRWMGDFDYSAWLREPTGPIRRDDEAMWYAAHPIPEAADHAGRPWLLLWLEREAEINEAVAQTKRILVSTLLIAIGLTYLLGAASARGFSRSFIRVAEASERVAGGELDAAIPVTGAREMRTMANSFNRMLADLRLHRERLEDLVADRTKSLELSREQLKRLTVQLRASYEAAPEAILIIGTDGNIIEANRNVEEFFGVPFEGLRGTALAERWDALMNAFADPREVREKWRALAEPTSEETASDEWEVRCPVRRQVTVFTSPVRDETGAIFARLWMFRDVTQRRRLEESLQQAQKMEAIGRLAGGVAHDFNNLLTGIEGNLSLLGFESEGRLGGSASIRLKLAQKACARAAGLVKGLLGYSRKSRLHREMCDVNQLIRETVALLKPTIDPRIRILTRLDPKLPSCDIDAGQIQQVFMNICVNARDAMPDGGRLTIATAAVTRQTIERQKQGTAAPLSAERYVRIDISDDGRGMTPEVRARMFEPFFTTKEHGKGTGLGMAMSYGITEQHGGWMTCDSKAGAGSKFSVYLPAAKPVLESNSLPSSEAAPPSPPPSAPPSRPPSGRSRDSRGRILVVDDEAVVRAVAEGLLRHLGYTVCSAVNGQDAIEQCREAAGSFDAVLLDMTMPVMCGREALRRFKADFPGLPVILCSGYSADWHEENNAPEAAAADGFIQKPYAVDDLSDTLRRVMDQDPAPDAPKASPVSAGRAAE